MKKPAHVSKASIQTLTLHGAAEAGLLEHGAAGLAFNVAEADALGIELST
jgi:hypothetical protein